MALLGTALFTALSILSPLLLRHLLDDVIRPGQWDKLHLAVLLILLAPLTAAVIRYVNVHVIMLTARRFVAAIRVAMYEKILRLGWGYHTTHASGALVGRLMDDVNMLQRLLTGDTIQILVDIIVFSFAISVLFILSWKLAAIVCLTLVLYVAAYRIFSRRIRGANEAYRGLYDEISARLQETLAGVRQVRIYNREDSESNRFLNRTARSLDQQLSSQMSSVGLSGICSGIAGYGSTLIAALGAYFVVKNEMTYGDLYAVDNYVWMAVNPVIRLTNLAGQLAETLVSVRRVAEVLDEPMDIRSDPSAPKLEQGPGAVTFENVFFSYPPDTPLFQDLSLEMPAGKTIAFVGHTGCGKTSLISLLMRYWDVDKGTIRIDGQNIRDVELRSLREKFGVVLQQPVLFEGTLAENIAYGRPDASREDIEAAARMAEVYDMAMDLPRKFNTVIGTNGVKLSVGERQRVSIARAILRNPMIFIMDEATSALDSESEALIQKALNHVFRGRTSIVIAHRLSTVMSADRIVVMERGKIVESGTHAELMAREHGVYRAYCLQLRSSAEEDAP